MKKKKNHIYTETSSVSAAALSRKTRTKKKSRLAYEPTEGISSCFNVSSCPINDPLQTLHYMICTYTVAYSYHSPPEVTRAQQGNNNNVFESFSGIPFEGQNVFIAPVCRGRARASSPEGHTHTPPGGIKSWCLCLQSMYFPQISRLCFSSSCPEHRSPFSSSSSSSSSHHNFPSRAATRPTYLPRKIHDRWQKKKKKSPPKKKKNCQGRIKINQNQN